jgi:hypothetical protein
VLRVVIIPVLYNLDPNKYGYEINLLQVINNEKLSQPIRVLSDLRGHRVTSDPVTWLDVCRGGQNTLSLRYVVNMTFDYQIVKLNNYFTSYRMLVCLLYAFALT